MDTGGNSYSSTMDSDSEKEMIHALRQALSTVAVVASLSIMYIYARFPDMRNWSYTMVLLMTLCGTGGNLADLIVVDDSRLQDTSFMCYVQGVAGQFFDLSSALWAGAICYSLYTVVVLEHRLEAPFKRSCHAFVWGLSVVLMLLPFTTSSYGMAGQWCWIKAPAGDKKDFSTDDGASCVQGLFFCRTVTFPSCIISKGTIWRLVCFYIPIWATIMSISVLYYKISMTLKNYVRCDTAGACLVVFLCLLPLSHRRFTRLTLPLLPVAAPLLSEG